MDDSGQSTVLTDTVSNESNETQPGVNTDNNEPSSVADESTSQTVTFKLASSVPATVQLSQPNEQAVNQVTHGASDQDTNQGRNFYVDIQG